MDKRDELIFSSPISMLRFSPDGNRLFVLTVSQNTYLFDVSQLAKTARSESRRVGIATGSLSAN